MNTHEKEYQRYLNQLKFIGLDTFESNEDFLLWKKSVCSWMIHHEKHLLKEETNIVSKSSNDSKTNFEWDLDSSSEYDNQSERDYHADKENK